MRQTWESFKVTGDDLLRRVKEILHEGNVRRIVIKQGARTVVEFPVTVGVVGALASVGALAALLTECTTEVERERNAPSAPPPPTVRVTRKKKS